MLTRADGGGGDLNQHQQLSNNIRRYDNSDAYAAISGTASWPEQLRAYLTNTTRRCTLSFDDVHSQWFHARCTRREAERLVLSALPGSFLVRLSESKENQLALTSSSIDAPGVVIHSLIRAVYPGFAIDAGQVFSTISQLIASRPELRHPVSHDAAVAANSSNNMNSDADNNTALISCTDVLRRIGERLRAGESISEFHWILATLRFDFANMSATHRTVVRYAAEEHISSYWLGFDANLIRLLGDIFQQCNNDTRCGTFQALRINGCNEGADFAHALTDVDSRLLARYCASYNALVLLDLQVNRIGDAGAAALANCIGKSRSLRCVDVRRNFITHRGATCLQRALLVNRALVRLDIMPQMMTTPALGELARNPCPRLRVVTDTIEEVFITRRLLWFEGFALHGFLSHAQADARLHRGRQALSYLHADHPMCIIVASLVSGEITRTIVRRCGNGYASSAARDERRNSLFMRAAWSVLALRATAIAKQKASAIGVDWTALQLLAVLGDDDRALCVDERDEQLSRMPPRLRGWLESGAILDNLWCLMEVPPIERRDADWSDDELEIDSNNSGGSSWGEGKSLSALLYENRQGMMSFVTPISVRATVAPQPQPQNQQQQQQTTVQQRQLLPQRGANTEKSMFQVKI